MRYSAQQTMKSHEHPSTSKMKARVIASVTRLTQATEPVTYEAAQAYARHLMETQSRFDVAQTLGVNPTTVTKITGIQISGSRSEGARRTWSDSTRRAERLKKIHSPEADQQRSEKWHDEDVSTGKQRIRLQAVGKKGREINQAKIQSRRNNAFGENNERLIELVAQGFSRRIIREKIHEASGIWVSPMIINSALKRMNNAQNEPNKQ